MHEGLGAWLKVQDKPRKCEALSSIPSTAKKKKIYNTQKQKYGLYPCTNPPPSTMSIPAVLISSVPLSIPCFPLNNLDKWIKWTQVKK
jgi:hypothetical protein